MMGETAVLVRMEQEGKNVAVEKLWKEMDGEITQLQSDVLDQNDLNTTQEKKIDHLEKLVEALTDRIKAMEDKATT
jgi:hypothetical protein